MSPLEIFALVLIAVGAIVNFLVPAIIKKKIAKTDIIPDKIYIIKSVGLILVVIGCIIFFWLGGKFGV